MVKISHQTSSDLDDLPWSTNNTSNSNYYDDVENTTNTSSTDYDYWPNDGPAEDDGCPRFFDAGLNGYLSLFYCFFFFFWFTNALAISHGYVANYSQARTSDLFNAYDAIQFIE